MSHWRMGMNLPEHPFSTSWATMPPRTAAMGERSPRALEERSVTSFASILSTSLAEELISSASATTSAAWALFPGIGNALFLARKASTAWKPIRSCSWRSILAKSEMRNSGAAIDSRIFLKGIVAGIFTCLTYPPETYAPNLEVSLIENVYGPVTLISTGSIALSSAIPLTSVNVTKSPVSRPCRTSSRVVTMPTSSWVTPEIIAESACSPLVSFTTNAGPKSTKMFPKTPRDWHATKQIPFAWHTSSTWRARSKVSSDIRTTWNCLIAASSSSPACTRMSTYGLRSRSFAAETSARFFPTSASEK
mmetsp:Transcript_47391/g.112775  ORF Transcript_47391/g.112775 Transcript_47391/m.112775 type:complete len:306 (-) Transcript_47391:320-1237(-)